MFYKKFIFIFLLSCYSLTALENSIVPLVNQIEQIENLDEKKYSTLQRDEIAEALKLKDQTIRIATYNVLFHKYDDKKPLEQRWVERLPGIVELLQEMKPDILGVQELYPAQLETLMPYLEGEYAFYGLPCDDEELNGFFYLKKRFTVIDSQVWYMQEEATLTMLQLQDQLTGKIFAVLNTHLSFSKVDKRAFQANFIGEKVEVISKQMPVFLMGDMNTFSQRQDLKKLPFYDGEYVQRLMTRKSLRDSKEISILGHVGPLSTFTNATEEAIPFTGVGTPGIFLDHIFVSESVLVLIHAVQPATRGGHFPSDHMPLFIDAVIIYN